jgi:hypothetical protein
VVIPSPAFSLIKTASQAISTSVSTKITWDSAEFDLTSDTDLTNNRFTPSVAGYYQFNGNVRLDTLSDGNIVFLLFFKNGSEIKRGIQYRQGGGGSINVNASCLVYMNGSTDYVEVYVQHDYGADRNIASSSTYTTFSGFLARAV